MNLSLAFLKIVGRAILDAVAVGPAGDVLCDVLPEVARLVWDWWSNGRSPAERRAEVQALAEASPAEIRQAVAQTVEALAADQPPEIQRRLSIYLGAGTRGLAPRSGARVIHSGDTPPSQRTRTAFSHCCRATCLVFSQAIGRYPASTGSWKNCWELAASGKCGRPETRTSTPCRTVALKFCLDPSAKDHLLRHEAGHP